MVYRQSAVDKCHNEKVGKQMRMALLLEKEINSNNLKQKDLNYNKFIFQFETILSNKI